MRNEKSNCPPSKKLIAEGIDRPPHMYIAASSMKIDQKTATCLFVLKYRAFLMLWKPSPQSYPEQTGSAELFSRLKIFL